MKPISLYPSPLVAGALFAVVLIANVSCCAQQKAASRDVKGYGKASYSATEAGQFMNHWLLAGPFPVSASGIPDDAAQKGFFDANDLLSVEIQPKKKLSALQRAGTTVQWITHSSTDGTVDLDAVFGGKDFASAYALAEIISESDKKVIFAFGSDDGIKVVLNGKVVHNNWVPRGITPDEDVVPATLVRGSNQLIILVQDMQSGWGFTCRILDNQALGTRLTSAAAKGNIDLLSLLINAGANVNSKDDAGLTAMNAAKLQGRSDVIALLKSKGATDAPMPAAPLLIDREYAMLNGKKAAGIAVLAARDGKIVYEKGFGYANIAGDEPITPETKFRIGSITKQFLGAAILKLQEEGKISVHDKLSKFLPGFQKGDEVTIHHLLTHTSGIHSYTNKESFIATVTSPITEDSLVSLIQNEPYDFEPGERFLYNNSGYFLLGHIIRKVTGKSFGDYLGSAFFQPLGMTNTGVYEASLKLSREAMGYKKENGEYKADINWDMSWAGGAGALYSNVRDLYVWNEALFAGKVISKESLNAAFTPVILNNGKTPVEPKYGYGWGIGSFRGVEVLEHGGGLHGFSTRIARYPSQNLTVIMLTNVIPTEVTLTPNTIAEYLLWEELEAQSSFSLKSTGEDVKQYVGRYDFGNGMLLTVSDEGQNLFAQVSGQPRFPIFPAGIGEYFWKVVEARIKFLKNDQGEVTGGAFSQGGNNINLVKVPNEVIVTIDPALLDYYVGVYNLGDDQVTVTKEDNKLYAKTNSSPRFEIKPLSDHEFTLQELNAKVTFVREDGQKASKFILDMAGQRKDVPRIE